MFLFVEIADAPVIPGNSGISARTNKPYTIPSKQQAALHSGSAFPHPFQIAVPEKEGPYKPGRYLIAGDDIVRSGEYGPQISMRDIRLVPFEEAAKVMTGGNVEKIAKAS